MIDMSQDPMQFDISTDRLVPAVGINYMKNSEVTADEIKKLVLVEWI